MPTNNQDDVFEITVVKVGRHKDAYPIFRGFPLGNPFPMRGEESLRDEVCDQYEEWFQFKLDTNDDLVTNELAKIIAKTIEQGYIRLECYCAPKRCHGETIARYLESVLN